MIKASLIYAAVTILLAFVDSVRIKRAKGIVENIDHGWSVAFAIWSGTLVIMLFIEPYHLVNYEFLAEWDINKLMQGIFAIPMFIFIRMCFFDISLNLWRRFKIDYESLTTSSYVDQHTNKLTFWDKRFIAMGAWFVCWLLYYLIFELK